MKLNEIKGERSLAAAAELITPLCNIAANEAAADLFVRRPCPDGMTAKAFMSERIKKALPVLMGECKDDVVAIIAVKEGKTPEEVEAELDVMTALNWTMEMVADESLKTFFAFAQTLQTSGESAPQNIEES